MIPSQFKVAGGKAISIIIQEFIKDKDGYKFGEFNDASNIIRIAEKIRIDDKEYRQTEEDMERTFWHEVFHCFQFYAGMDSDEMIAQVFSNFMYEYSHTTI